MYASTDFKSKKAFKDAVNAGEKITVYHPGLGDDVGPNATVTVCGPQYPAVHTWYAEVVLKDGYVFSVK